MSPRVLITDKDRTFKTRILITQVSYKP